MTSADETRVQDIRTRNNDHRPSRTEVDFLIDYIGQLRQELESARRLNTSMARRLTLLGQGRSPVVEAVDLFAERTAAVEIKAGQLVTVDQLEPVAAHESDDLDVIHAIVRGGE
jgi:hypothetical protein